MYDCRRGTDRIRVVVAGQLPQSEPNALLHLFSASLEPLRYGMMHYRQRSADTSTIIHQLLRGYQEEGLAMPYTVEDFRRDYAREHFPHLTAQEQGEALKSLPPENLREVLQSMSPENLSEALQSLSPENLSEVLQSLPPKQRFAGLPPEQIEAFLAQLKAEDTAAPPKKRRRKS